VLFYRARDLHTASTSNAGMRNVPITCDFVGGIHHHYTFIGFVREDTSYFTQQGGFSHTWATKNQDGLALFDNVTDQGNTAKHRSTNTAGQADNFPLSIAESADTVERPFDTSAVIVAKFADVLNYIL
jgi:hypothetical protein